MAVRIAHELPAAGVHRHGLGLPAVRLAEDAAAGLLGLVPVAVLGAVAVVVPVGVVVVAVGVALLVPIGVLGVPAALPGLDAALDVI